MKQTMQAEQHALDRLLYLLEENSIQHLAAADHTFAATIEDIYQHVNQHARQLAAR